MKKFIVIKKATKEKRRRDITRCRFILKIGQRSWHITLEELICMRDDANDLIQHENLRIVNDCKKENK